MQLSATRTVWFVPAVLAELEGLGKVSAGSPERGKAAAVGTGARSVGI